MKYYIKKVKPTEAFRLMVDRFPQWCHWECKIPQNINKIGIKGIGHWIYAYDGEWIVRDGDNLLHMSDDEFRESYIEFDSYK